MNSLIENCCFNIGNAAVRQPISIPIEFDPATFGQIFLSIPVKKHIYAITNFS